MGEQVDKEKYLNDCGFKEAEGKRCIAETVMFQKVGNLIAFWSVSLDSVSLESVSFYSIVAEGVLKQPVIVY